MGSFRKRRDCLTDKAGGWEPGYLHYSIDSLGVLSNLGLGFVVFLFLF